jgi:RNase adapter protein RapZ
VSDPLRAIVVTGLSGSGKSTALGVLEDLGYYCIDNLPVVLLPNFVDLWERTREDPNRVAFGIDVREGRFLPEAPQVLDELRRTPGVALEVYYLDAADDVLVRRFSETRRRHPADEGAGVAAAIRRERAALAGLRERADHIVDTSALTVHELRARLTEALVADSVQARLRVTVLSFGFKYGSPGNADLVFDCRFLPNPFFVEKLRPLDGRDGGVADYVLGDEDARAFLDHVLALLRFTIPRYEREGKSYLTVAVGCTGGRHRSVVLAEVLGRVLAEDGASVRVEHRDLGR